MSTETYLRVSRKIEQGDYEGAMNEGMVCDGGYWPDERWENYSDNRRKTLDMIELHRKVTKS